MAGGEGGLGAHDEQTLRGALVAVLLAGRRLQREAATLHARDDAAHARDLLVRRRARARRRLQSVEGGAASGRGAGAGTRRDKQRGDEQRAAESSIAPASAVPPAVPEGRIIRAALVAAPVQSRSPSGAARDPGTLRAAVTGGDRGGLSLSRLAARHQSLEGAFARQAETSPSGRTRFIDVIQPNANERIIYELRPNLKTEFAGQPMSTNSCGFRMPEFSRQKKPRDDHDPRAGRVDHVRPRRRRRRGTSSR
jgi:hypothetical protein